MANIYDAVIGTQRTIIDNGIDILEVDATTSANYSMSSQWTSFPVEDGDFITDHSIKNPITFTLNVTFSDDPMNFLSLSGSLERAINNSPRFSQYVFEYFTKARENSEIFKITDTLNVWENYAITDINIIRSPESRNAFVAALGFQQINIVESEQVDIDVPSNGANAKDQATKDKAAKSKSEGKKVPQDTQPVKSDLFKGAENFNIVG